MQRKAFNPASVSAPAGYSHATATTGGTTIQVSGQIAFDAGGKVVGVGDIGAQARQVYQNLDACLKAAGASFKDVVKLVTYVVNLSPDKAAAVRAVRREFLGEPFPSSTMVGVTALVHPDLLLEVEVVAVIPERVSRAKKAAPARKAAKKASTRRAGVKRAPAKKAARRR